MNLLSRSALGLAAVVGALSMSTGPAQATTAQAGTAQAGTPIDYLVIYSSGDCDRTTGQWVIDWSIQNLSADAATIADVTSTPTASPVGSLPTSIAAESTIHAAQRISGSGGQTASLRITTTWPSGVSHVSDWQFRPHSPCEAAPTRGSWPIVDQDGIQRSSVSIDWSTGYATACYGGTNADVRIEVRFASGETQKRIVPQFGCTVAGPYAGTGPVVAVRGLVGDFANPWHENA